MCGVLSHFTFRVGDGDLDIQFRAALETLANRGPDGCQARSFENGRLRLGHSLLSITGADRAEEPQPFETDDLVIVFNGEIYNYPALMQQMVAAQFPVRGATDTAVLAAGLAAHGFVFLQRVIGCWAIIVFDRKAQRLYFARDHYGEKQLTFRYLPGESLSVSSEVKALAELAPQPLAPSIERMRADLIFDFLASRRTSYFDGVDNAIPGTLYCLDLRDCTLMSQPLFNPVAHTRPSKSLAAALTTATCDMIPAHRPYGIVLSGGLDSSILAGILSRKLTRPATALTIRYKGTENADAEAAIALCNELGNIDHHLLDLDSSVFSQHFQRVQYVLEEPLYDHVYVSQYLIYHWFRKTGLDVALNGQASDEFWRGYQYHYALSNLDALATRADVAAFYMAKAQDRGLDQLFTSDELRATIDNELADFPEHPEHGQIADGLCIGRHLQAMLAHEDRLSMASGVEVRLPCLHRDVLAHAMAMPPSKKLVDGLEKAPLRAAVQGLVPDFVRLRRKQAFPDAPKGHYLAADAAIREMGNGALYPGAIIEALPATVQWKLHAQNAFVAGIKTMRLAAS
jgi:asparagine synthase (glutamine-hydrolysing)